MISQKEEIEKNFHKHPQSIHPPLIIWDSLNVTKVRSSPLQPLLHLTVSWVSAGSSPSLWNILLSCAQCCNCLYLKTNKRTLSLLQTPTSSLTLSPFSIHPTPLKVLSPHAISSSSLHFPQGLIPIIPVKPFLSTEPKLPPFYTQWLSLSPHLPPKQRWHAGHTLP